MAMVGVGLDGIFWVAHCAARMALGMHCQRGRIVMVSWMTVVPNRDPDSMRGALLKRIAYAMHGRTGRIQRKKQREKNGNQGTHRARSLTTFTGLSIKEPHQLSSQ